MSSRKGKQSIIINKRSFYLLHVYGPVASEV